MEQRKIQLVAGTTYALSLPKPWIQKNALHEGQQLMILEQENGTLIISKNILETKHREKITLNVDDYEQNIDQIILKLFYLGFEKIELFSKNLRKETKTKIRAALQHLIGTEIVQEEQNKITIKVLLDKSKVDVIQSLFRMGLIIEQMLSNVLEEIDIKEMSINENETDRLYNLISKMLSLSLTDAALLQTSKIQNVNFITHYMLITKRLEIIADNILWLARYLDKNNKKLELEHKRAVADFIRRELNRTIRHMMADYPTIFTLPNKEEINKIQGYIDMIADGKIKEHLSYPVKLVLDNEEEIVSISFSKRLMREKII